MSLTKHLRRRKQKHNLRFSGSFIGSDLSQVTDKLYPKNKKSWKNYVQIKTTSLKLASINLASNKVICLKTKIK
jgi:hypothetical protein